MDAFDFAFTSIDGRPMPLDAYRGKVLLVVNVASFCGLTPQYEGLETLSKQYRDQGLVVIGVPANDFGAQEPGTEAEIHSFCTTRFAVDFPMTSKVPVVGPAAHPFYERVVAELGADAAPKWNFHKYLVGRDGKVTSFGSRTAPDAPELLGAIEAALKG
ncbi:MAG TPA: glutathione peroxidase [Aliidongia sp.]|uniref:glutathione peroxidase n=1 Tax=Aliidongia sp. TaxID=1914230 RepID=UPI002DDCB386|nr:glutathione peroxidase [Aliidongia sp.]HEV2672972.1 glutathione peroxidase [Aliidongia sp.]